MTQTCEKTNQPESGCLFFHTIPVLEKTVNWKKLWTKGKSKNNKNR